MNKPNFDLKATLILGRFNKYFKLKEMKLQDLCKEADSVFGKLVGDRKKDYVEENKKIVVELENLSIKLFDFKKKND